MLGISLRESRKAARLRKQLGTERLREWRGGWSLWLSERRGKERRRKPGPSLLCRHFLPKPQAEIQTRLERRRGGVRLVYIVESGL